MPGVKAETQVMALDLAGVRVSAGCGLLVGQGAARPVLAAMGVDDAGRLRHPHMLRWNTAED